MELTPQLSLGYVNGSFHRCRFEMSITHTIAGASPLVSTTTCTMLPVSCFLLTWEVGRRKRLRSHILCNQMPKAECLLAGLPRRHHHLHEDPHRGPVGGEADVHRLDRRPSGGLDAPVRLGIFLVGQWVLPTARTANRCSAASSTSLAPCEPTSRSLRRCDLCSAVHPYSHRSGLCSGWVCSVVDAPARPHQTAKGCQPPPTFEGRSFDRPHLRIRGPGLNGRRVLLSGAAVARLCSQSVDCPFILCKGGRPRLADAPLWL